MAKMINLDSLISKYIHRPLVSRGSELPPLYARSGNESESTVDLKGIKDPRWIAASEKVYNSPTNVRRIYIGSGLAVMEYFYNVAGTNRNVSSSTYDSEDIIDIHSKSYNHTGLGSISINWKMSNIEEIYIDSFILYINGVNTNLARILQKGSTITDAKIASLLVSLFCSSNGVTPENIHTRFPRLRTIGVVDNLDRILKMQKGSIGVKIPSSLDEFNFKWYKAVEVAFKNNAPNMIIANLPVNDDVFTSFSLRTGIYKYDRDILENRANEIIQKYKDLKNKYLTEKRVERQREVENNKSEFEQYLDNCVKKYDSKKVTIALKLALARESKESIDNIFNSMSDYGKDVYRNMLGR